MQAAHDGVARRQLPLDEQVRQPRIRQVGDCAILVECGARICSDVLDRVSALDRAIAAACFPGVVETIPSYASVLVVFDPVLANPEKLAAQLAGLQSDPVATLQRATRRWRVPVLYGPPYGVDLDEIAERSGMSSREVIAAHAGADYRVYMLGFLPGFAYLGGLPAALATPRRSSPRPDAPAGVIAIGGAQTAVGSIAGPCGWNIIGRTPMRGFMPGRDPVALFAAGDEVRFESIDQERFARMEAEARRGAWVAERAA